MYENPLFNPFFCPSPNYLLKAQWASSPMIVLADKLGLWPSLSWVLGAEIIMAKQLPG